MVMLAKIPELKGRRQKDQFTRKHRKFKLGFMRPCLRKSNKQTNKKKIHPVYYARVTKTR